MKKIIVIVCLLGLVKWWITDPSIDTSSDGVSFQYLVKYPAGNGNNDTLPMLVALHGNGDSAQNFYETALDQLSTPARIILLKGPLSHAGGDAWPWDAAGFKQYAQPFSEAVAKLSIKFPTQGKPILMGFSGGAMMAYYQAIKHGNHYSYVIPVSGQLNEDWMSDNNDKIEAKVLAYHGKNDGVVSFYSGKKAADLLQMKGVNVRFTEFDGNHHGMFTTMKSSITKVIEQRLENQ